MAKRSLKKETPLFCLDDFTLKAKENSFYIETLQTHLKNHAFISKPHKHDFYLLLYITKGGGEHVIDFKSYPMRPGSFFLMTPGQVHAWNLEDKTDGYIIFFQRHFYQLQSTENNLVEFPFFHSLHANPLLQLKKNHTIEVLIQDMLEEFSTSSTLDHRILRSYLDLLLLKLAKEYPVKGQKEFTNSSTFKLRKLEALIEEHYSILKTPGEYAELMNLSTAHLNMICKQNLGKTLSYLIQERIILEAKRLFSYSDLTINQVSDQLNFADASYFIRFFKKFTGITPVQFKKH